MNTKILYLILLFISIFKINGQEAFLNDGVFIDFNQFKLKKPCEVKSFKLKDKTDLLITIDNIDTNCKGFKKNK